MINDTNLKQNGGAGSTNYQANSITIIQGVTPEIAKEKALEVFKENFIQLASEAREIASKRAEEIVDRFLSKLLAASPELLCRMKEPSMQYSLYSIQREYAKNGEIATSELLIEILVNLAALPERNLTQVLLNECMTVVPKLTIEQINALSLHFFAFVYKGDDIYQTSLKDYIENYLKPFDSQKQTNIYEVNYMLYSGCVSLNKNSSSFLLNFFHKHTNLFSEGFTFNEFISIVGKSNKLIEIEMLIICPNNPYNFKVFSTDLIAICNTASNFGLNENQAIELWKLNNRITVEILEYHKLDSYEAIYLCELSKNWKGTYISTMELTIVGIAIAITNINRKLGVVLSLDDYLI
ncbi:MAG: LPO_1073/Vpar_1526 family protein [Bacteroidota bacterium]